MGVKTKAGILIGIYTASQFAGLLGDDSHKAMEKSYDHSVADASTVFDDVDLPSGMSDYLHTLGFAGPGEKIIFKDGAFKILQQLNPEQKLALAVLDYAPKEVIQYVNGDFQILPFPEKDGFPRIDPKKESIGKDTYKERKKAGFNLPFLGVARAAEDGIIKPGVGDGIKYKPGESSEKKGYDWLDTPKNIAGWFGSVFGSWGDAIGNLLKLRSEVYAEPSKNIKEPIVSNPSQGANLNCPPAERTLIKDPNDPSGVSMVESCIATANSGAGKDKSASPGTTPKATITPKPIHTPTPGKGSGAVMEKEKIYDAVKYDADGKGIVLKTEVDWSNPDAWYEFDKGALEALGVIRDGSDMYILYLERSGLDGKTFDGYYVGVTLEAISPMEKDINNYPRLAMMLRDAGAELWANTTSSSLYPKYKDPEVKSIGRMRQVKFPGYATILQNYKPSSDYPGGTTTAISITSSSTPGVTLADVTSGRKSKLLISIDDRPAHDFGFVDEMAWGKILTESGQTGSVQYKSAGVNKK